MKAADPEFQSLLHSLETYFPKQAKVSNWNSSVLRLFDQRVWQSLMESHPVRESNGNLSGEYFSVKRYQNRNSQSLTLANCGVDRESLWEKIGASFKLGTTKCLVYRRRWEFDIELTENSLAITWSVRASNIGLELSTEYSNTLYWIQIAMAPVWKAFDGHRKAFVWPLELPMRILRIWQILSAQQNLLTCFDRCFDHISRWRIR